MFSTKNSNSISQLDVTQIDSISQHVSNIFSRFPDIDTVIISAGIQHSFSLFDPSSISDASITSEITTDLVAPILLSRAFLPHLSTIAASSRHANLILFSSALGFIPLPYFPVYCPTKAAVHAFCMSTRAQLGLATPEVQKYLSITEIVPPYVDTPLDAAHRAKMIEM